MQSREELGETIEFLIKVIGLGEECPLDIIQWEGCPSNKDLSLCGIDGFELKDCIKTFNSKKKNMKMFFKRMEAIKI